jgi:hypothetical protein
MWKCFEGPMAAQHPRCGDQLALLGWDSADYKEQRNPAYKEATQVGFQECKVQSSVPPAEDAWTPYEPPTHLGDESKKTKEATGGIPVCPLLRLNNSFHNASVGGFRPKQEPKSPRRASMSRVDENGIRVKAPSNRSLRGKRSSTRSLYLGKIDEDNGEPGTASDAYAFAKPNDVIPEKRGPHKAPKSRRASMSRVDENGIRVKAPSTRSLRGKRSSTRSLYLGKTEQANGEPGTASGAHASAKPNDALPSVLSTQSFGAVVIPEKRGPAEAPKSLNENKLLVANQIPPVARKISYLQLEIYIACEIVEDDTESGWAFKTPTTIVKSGPQPPTSTPITEMRAVWCLV